MKVLDTSATRDTSAARKHGRKKGLLSNKKFRYHYLSFILAAIIIRSFNAHLAALQCVTIDILVSPMRLTGTITEAHCPVNECGSIRRLSCGCAAHLTALSCPSPHHSTSGPKASHGKARAPPITGPRMAPNPYAVPRYPIATVCELKSVLSASMHFTLVKLELNLHSTKHVDQLCLPRLPCSSQLCLNEPCSGHPMSSSNCVRQTPQQ